MSANARSFPDGFRWGTATSAHQVEGGNRLNDWWEFEGRPGAIADGTRSGDAVRHAERFDEDFALSAADGHGAHRLSFEWSRLEPEPGRIDAAAVAHYHEVLASLKRHRLEPMVTLHHFTNPRWIAAAGGWESRETLDRFEVFVRFCAREYGGEVDVWCTVNEPDVYAFRAYAAGEWPPGVRDESRALVVLGNLLEAHGRAFRALHEDDRVDADGDGRAVLAGFAKNYPILVADRPWFPPDVARAAFERRVFNDAVLRAPVDGALRLEIPGAKPVRREVPELKDSLDWIGLNYYTRYGVRMFAAEAHVARRGAPVTDMGWEIHPAGIVDALRALPKVPVRVTENGFADAEDSRRPRALVETLDHLADAIARGVADVRAYYHWSLLDNFEWSDGWAPRFGLYAVDPADPALTRRRRPSADLYARISRANAVTADERRDAQRPPR